MRALLCLLVALSACGRRGEAPALDGTWRLDPARSRYAGTAEARVDETFTCRTGERIECEIVGIKARGDTTRARFSALPDGDGTVSGVEGLDRVRISERDDGYDAVFLHGTNPVLGYRITADADSLIVQTTDARTGELLDTRIVYVRSEDL